MSKATFFQPSTNMTDTGDVLMSTPMSPLPMSIELHASTPCPPVPFCHGDPKTNDQLIHKATTRLRCRLLEQGLNDAKTKVSHLQGELDNLRIELSTTENVLSKFGEPDDRQLLALERRFNTHQQQLDFLLSNTSTRESHLQQSRPQLQENAITASTSFSSTLSRMSSIFSSRQQPFKKTDHTSTAPFGSGSHHHHRHNDSSMTNDTCSTSEYDSNSGQLQHTAPDSDAKERRMRRRQRVKQLRQEYQQRLRTYDSTWNDNDEHDWRSATTPCSVNGKQEIPDEPVITTTPTTTITTTQEATPTQPAQHQNLAPTSKNQQQQQQQQQQHHTITNTTGKKKMVAKHTSNATKKPMIISTKPTTQSKPAAPLCLCKRKTTNKTDPIKAASSPHSPAYHSKQPEKVLLETQQQKQQQHHPLSPVSASPLPTAASVADRHETTHTLPSDTHVLALPPSNLLLANSDGPPSSSNVSDWLLKQRQYHLEQQQQYNDDDDEVEEDRERAWMKKETLIDNQEHHDVMATFTANGNSNNNDDDNDSMMKPLPPHIKQPSSNTMTIFDDVLRYLDTMSDFGNDSGLQQDLSHLLAVNSTSSSRAPSLCSSISSALSSSTLGSYYGRHWSSSSLLQTQPSSSGLVGKYCSRYLVDGVNKSLSWCKFLSVLSLALLISLGRGPDHMLLSLDDLDYLDLMADQGEPFVRSYYL